MSSGSLLLPRVRDRPIALIRFPKSLTCAQASLSCLVPLLPPWPLSSCLVNASFDGGDACQGGSLQLWKKTALQKSVCDRPGKRRCRPAQSWLGSQTAFTFFLPGSLCGGRVFGCSSTGWLDLKPGKKQTQAGRKGSAFPLLPATEMAGSHCKVSRVLNQHTRAVHHLGGLRQVTA